MGTLPPGLGAGWRAVEEIQVSGDLEGPLPAEWASMTALTSLTIAGSAKRPGRLSGAIPDRLVEAWQSMAALDLSFNQLTGTLRCVPRCAVF